MSVPSPIRKSSGSFKSTLFGIAISFGCIWILTRTVDVDQTINALRDVDPYPLGLSVVLTAITVACRALRWQALLRPESRAGFWSAVEATLIGYLFIAVLPGRVGELTRAAVLGRTESVPTGRAVGTIVIEKIFDIAALLIMLGVLSLIIPLPLWARTAGVTVTAVFAILTVGFVVASSVRPRLVAWIQRRVDPVPVIRRANPSRLADGLLQAASSLTSANLLGIQLLASTVLWLLAICQVYLGTRAFHLDTGWDAATFVLVATNLGMTVPSAPASLGVYHGITVLALDVFNVTAPTALGLAVGMHTLGFGTLSLAGAFCLVRGLLLGRFAIVDLWKWRA